MALDALSLEEVMKLSPHQRTCYFDNFARYIPDSLNLCYAIRVGSKTLQSDDTMQLRQMFDKYLDGFVNTVALQVVKFSSYRMRNRGLGLAGSPKPLAVYSFRRNTRHGAYLMTAEQATKLVSADAYVGKSRPSIMRGPYDDLLMCWGEEPTSEQRQFLYAQRKG